MSPGWEKPTTTRLGPFSSPTGVDGLVATYVHLQAVRPRSPGDCPIHEHVHLSPGTPCNFMFWVESRWVNLKDILWASIGFGCGSINAGGVVGCLEGYVHKLIFLVGVLMPVPVVCFVIIQARVNVCKCVWLTLTCTGRILLLDNNDYSCVIELSLVWCAHTLNGMHTHSAYTQSAKAVWRSCNETQYRLHWTQITCARCEISTEVNEFSSFFVSGAQQFICRKHVCTAVVLQIQIYSAIKQCTTLSRSFHRSYIFLFSEKSSGFSVVIISLWRQERHQISLVLNAVLSVRKLWRLLWCWFHFRLFWNTHCSMSVHLSRACFWSPFTMLQFDSFENCWSVWCVLLL